MHNNFYHWHARAELKPETAMLEPRWKAAAKFAEELAPADILSLLRLALFPSVDLEFAKRFSEALVKAEPTFPPDGNNELLRVMAAAALYSQLEIPSNVANALALGLRSADFPQGRVEPVCQELTTRAIEYLTSESEKIRPTIYLEILDKSEKQIETLLAALKKAVDANEQPKIGEANLSLARGTFKAVKESHQQLGQVIGRLAEESQFLWWLIGRRSSALNMPRDLLTSDAYSLAVAAEASERVALIPPPASAESLIEQALSQCAEAAHENAPLSDLIAAATAHWVQSTSSTPTAPELAPVTAILAAKPQTGKPTQEALKGLGIKTRAKFTPVQIAQQYFRELMFLKALQAVN